MHVYLLDDDSLGLEIKADIFTSMGLQVSTFKSFQDASHSLILREPGLILSDFYLNTDQNGLSFWADHVVKRRIPFALWSGLFADAEKHKSFSIRPFLSLEFQSQWMIFETTMKHHDQSIPLIYLEHKTTKHKGLIPLFKKPCSVNLPLSYFNLIENHPASLHQRKKSLVKI